MFIGAYSMKRTGSFENTTKKTKHLQQELYDHAVVSMTFFTQENSDIMRLWNHAPRWPNALAAGMLVYLAGYVAMRCWRNN